MAKYTITDEAKLELLNIPSEVLPKNVLVQTKTFPIRSILEGMEQELEPLEIGNMVYDELSKLEMDNFTDVGMRKSYDWAKFVQAAVQKKLESMIDTTGTEEPNPEEEPETV